MRRFFIIALIVVLSLPAAAARSPAEDLASRVEQ
jgi:hypothetical protein